MKTLLENSKDLDLDIKDVTKQTPLIIASIHGYYEIAEMLISHGASLVEKKGKKKGPILFAAKNGHTNIVSLLIRKGVHPEN